MIAYDPAERSTIKEIKDSKWYRNDDIAT